MWSQIQMKLPLKSKTFSHFFIPFLETKSNFKHSVLKMIVILTLFRKLPTIKDLVRQLSKNHFFRALFDSEHVKGSQTLVESE